MQDRLQLSAGWQVCSTTPDACPDPQSLARAAVHWIPTSLPGTVAGALRAQSMWSLDGPARRFDADDWWYQLTFPAPESLPGNDAVLGFDGLATVADVWLNGTHILSSDNMFVAHECQVGGLLKAQNQLSMRFRALDPLLKAKRPRSRWRAPMIENQQLRWFRTTVLGRTPGWSPPCAAVGPWRDVWLQSRASTVDKVQLTATISDGAGCVAIDCRTHLNNDAAIAVELVVSGHGSQHRARLTRQPDGRLVGECRVANPRLWWPHTHGEPSLYQVSLKVAVNGGPPLESHLGAIGFRTVELDTANGNFEISVNGTRIFCRGACWTPLDAVTLHAEPAACDTALAQVKDAGMNMLRIAGTMVYESDGFYDRCDELGILVWQDFMFANMDYPGQDHGFAQSVTREAAQILSRLRHRPALTVLCGNSEVEQQAAMWGAPRASWSTELFHVVLRDLAASICPGVPYWPSSAHGGAFPHQADSGTTSYYGVGAYLRPLEDARRSELRFATECLALANVPEAATIEKMPDGAAVRVHHPGWKQRSPRDLGAGWDFDDVRDHYLKQIFGADALNIRRSDHARYLALSRATSAQVISATLGEWRRSRSTCKGALVWLLRDLWPGAGWGLIGADGVPKSPYYALRHTCQPVSVLISDEGINGLSVHVINEPALPLEASLEVKLYLHGEHLVGEVNRAIRVPGCTSLQIVAGELFDEFRDLAYAYRFGPPPHDLVCVTLRAPDNSVLGRCHYLPLGLSAQPDPDIGLVARAAPNGAGGYVLTVQSRKFANFVTVSAEGYACDDQYYTLSPATERNFTLRAIDAARQRPLRGTVQALNASNPVAIELPG